MLKYDSAEKGESEPNSWSSRSVWTFSAWELRPVGDLTIVAWHEVPGKGSPQEIRPVGYGVTGRCRDAQVADPYTHPPGLSEEAGNRFRRKIPLGLAEPTTPYPTGRISWDTFSRHFVRGYHPSVPTGRLAGMQNVRTPMGAACNSLALQSAAADPLDVR